MTQREILESYMKNFKATHPKVNGVTFTILAEETGFPRSTIRRLMVELKKAGVVKVVKRLKVKKAQSTPLFVYVPKEGREILVKATQNL